MPADVTITLGGDPRELDRLLRASSGLQRDLRELSLQPHSGKSDGSLGAKGDLLTIAQIVVPVITSSGVIAAIVQLAKARLENPSVRTVKLEIGDKRLELTRATDEQQDAALQAWMDSVTTNTDD